MRTGQSHNAKYIHWSNQPLGTGWTTPETLEPEDAVARARGKGKPIFGLAYLANGFTRNVTGAAGFARALEKAVSNNTLGGAASPPPTTGT